MLATVKRDIPVDIDLQAELVKSPDRSRLREMFRDFELRDPLRRLEEALEDSRRRPRCRAPRPTTAIALPVERGPVARRRRPAGRRARAGRRGAA